jgi:hypothetical protein
MMMNVMTLRNHRQPYALFYQASVSMSSSYPAKGTAAAALSLVMALLLTRKIATAIPSRLSH